MCSCPDAYWYASYLRIAYAESADVKSRFLEAADLIERLADENKNLKDSLADYDSLACAKESRRYAEERLKILTEIKEKIIAQDD